MRLHAYALSNFQWKQNDSKYNDISHIHSVHELNKGNTVMHGKTGNLFYLNWKYFTGKNEY